MPNEQPKGSVVSDDVSTQKKSVGVVTGINMSAIPIPAEPVPYEQSEERSLVRKIDWRIMPYLWGYAVLSAVDVRDMSCIHLPSTAD